MADHDDSAARAPAEWIEALYASRADLAAGRTVPGEKVLADLRAAVARMEALKGRKATDAA
jgi:hypothetical protein